MKPAKLVNIKRAGETSASSLIVASLTHYNCSKNRAFFCSLRLSRLVRQTANIRNGWAGFLGNTASHCILPPTCINFLSLYARPTPDSNSLDKRGSNL